MPVSPLTPSSSNFFTPANQVNGNGYDAAGNQTTYSTNTLTYDAKNQLTKVADSASGGSVQYYYDANGQRVVKGYLDGNSRVYAYDAFGRLAAEYSTVSQPPAPGCGTCYLAADQLGSVRLITDANANVVARHDFLPFGEEVSAGMAGRDMYFGQDAAVNQKFTGQERDQETNLDFFQARFMSSLQGRFLSPDPFNAGADPSDPQSWNAYGYVGNNPLARIDPTGMSWLGDLWNGISNFFNGGCSATFCVTGTGVADIDGSYALLGWGLGGGSSSSQSKNPPPPPPAYKFTVTVTANPPKTGNCPSVPTGPGKDVLIANINTAEQAAQIFDAQPGGNLMKIKWYYDNVRTGGPMDYKNQPTLHAHPEYDEFGQFNFGAVGSALSLPEEFIKQAAGIASFASFLRQGKLPPKSFGLPWTGPPYGDQPWAQPQISAGYRFTFVYHRGGC